MALIKGIEKGDQSFRHFTFDENDYIQKNGVYYYRVNYGKSKLEGPDAEDETGFVACAKVIPLGGMRPKTIPGQTIKQVSQPVQTVQTPTPESGPKKRGRKPKVEKVELSTEVIPVSVQSDFGTFEYWVEEIKSNHIEDLQNKLNQRGSEGWELCGFDTNKQIFGDIHIIAIFKRKRG